MTPNDVITHYESIVELTGKMADAARNDDWDNFNALEDRCAEESKAMLEQDIPQLTGAAKVRKIELLKQILANDRAIRAITEPWAEQVDSLLKGKPAAQRPAMEAAC
jgi:flagellar protein FliT